MKIGILSDTHNHLENTARALSIFRQHGVERVIHCGDITTPAVVGAFAGWQVDFALGNMDRNISDLKTAVRALGLGSIGHTCTIETNGKRLVACHGDNARTLIEFIHCGLYDYVFHGHTHSRRDEIVGQTRVINPGALGGTARESRSVCIVDLETAQAVFVELETE
jgi:putative phosphoesterase